MVFQCDLSFKPCFSESCRNHDGNSSICWIFMFVQFLTALFLLSFTRVRRRWNKCYFCRRKVRKKLGKRFVSGNLVDHHSIDDSSIVKEMMFPVLEGRGSSAFANVEPDGNDWDPQHMNSTSNPDELSNHNLNGIDIGDEEPEDFLPVHIKEGEEVGDKKGASHIDDLPHSPKEKKTVNSSNDKTRVKSLRTNDSQTPWDASRKEFVSKRLSNDSVHCRTDEKNPVLRTYRSQQNFLKNNDDISILFPSEYLPEYVPLSAGYNVSQSWQIMKSILNSKEAFELITVAAGSSFLSSGLSSIVAMVYQYERAFNTNCSLDTDVEGVHYTEWIESNGIALKTTIDGYKFLPIFLLLGYMGFLVQRWRTFMLTCHSIQGRMNDIGVLCGGEPSVPIQEADKIKLWNIYRLLNVIHILTLKSFSPSLKDLSIEPDYVEKLALLTINEAINISLMEIKAREGVVALLVHEVKELFESNNSSYAVNTVMEKICGLRGACASLHDLFVQDNPNEYIVSMKALIGVYCGLVVIGFPLILGTSPTVGCFQPVSLIGTFFVVFSLGFPLLLFNKLQNPFADNGIDVNNLIAGTELSLFQNLRAMWHFHTGGNSIVRAKRANYARQHRFSYTTMKGSFGEL